MSEKKYSGIAVSTDSKSVAELREFAARLPGVKDSLSSALDDLVKAYNGCAEGLANARTGCEEAIMDLRYVLTGIGESLAWMSKTMNETADRIAEYIAIHGEDPGSGSAAGASPGPSAGMGGQSMGMNPTTQDEQGKHI